jgi:hypothetical protein
MRALAAVVREPPPGAPGRYPARGLASSSPSQCRTTLRSTKRALARGVGFLGRCRRIERVTDRLLRGGGGPPRDRAHRGTAESSGRRKIGGAGRGARRHHPAGLLHQHRVDRPGCRRVDGIPLAALARGSPEPPRAQLHPCLLVTANYGIANVWWFSSRGVIRRRGGTARPGCRKDPRGGSACLPAR